MDQERKSSFEIKKEIDQLKENLAVYGEDWTNVVGQNQDASEVKRIESRIRRLKKKMKQRAAQELHEFQEKRKNTPLIENKSDQELKKLALAIYSGTVFTDRHIRKSDIPHMMGMIFMSLCLCDPSQIPLNAGCVYEHIDKAGPRSINGYPTFFSMKILSIEDTEKVFTEVRRLYEELGSPLSSDG